MMETTYPEREEQVIVPKANKPAYDVNGTPQKGTPKATEGPGTRARRLVRRVNGLNAAVQRLRYAFSCEKGNIEAYDKAATKQASTEIELWLSHLVAASEQDICPVVAALVRESGSRRKTHTELDRIVQAVHDGKLDERTLDRIEEMVLMLAKSAEEMNG